jgi:Flp pilus assembly protein TadG
VKPSFGSAGRLPSEERGQIAILMALFMALVLIVGACAIDVGLVYLSFARFRNAMDAAALAGASERQVNPASGTAGAEAVVRDVLQRHGYVDDAMVDIAVSFAITADGETVRVDAQQRQDTYFLRFFGVPQVDFGAATAAGLSGVYMDVVLSVDITGSMRDVANELPLAVAAFVDQVNPSLTKPTGPKLALVVWVGMKYPALKRDGQIATFLTYDKALLDKMADNTGPSNCPNAWPQPQPNFATLVYGPSTSERLCPVKPDGGTGTYIGNGFEFALRPSENHGGGGGGALWSLYSTAVGGRTAAKKYLVVMTDGLQDIEPLGEAELNAQTLAAAQDVKEGDDGIGGTADDVEIYTVGLFGQGESNFTTNPPKCPAATIPAGPSTVDTLLINSSSSTPGSCDRYYPLNKAQATQLPQLFTTIAGQLGAPRSKLTE